MSSVGPFFRGSIRPPRDPLKRWWLHAAAFLVSGWIHPICKNMAQIGFIFPNLRGRMKNYFKTPPSISSFQQLALLVLGRATSFDHSYWDSIVWMEGWVLGQEDGEQVGWQEKSDCRKTETWFLGIPPLPPPRPQETRPYYGDNSGTMRVNIV